MQAEPSGVAEFPHRHRGLHRLGIPGWRAAFCRYAALFFVLIAALPLSAQTPDSGAETPRPGFVQGTGIHLLEDQGADTAAFVIDLNDEVPHRIEALANPPRLTIDLERVVFSAQAARAASRSIGPVAGFRAGLFVTGQSRIVIDLARPALIERADYVRQGRAVRLVLQVRGTTPERFAARAESDAEARRKRRGEVATVPRSDPRPLIVIDPGHGGIDPGASGPKGELEKDIVLVFARALRDQLLIGGRVQVEMTRDDDRFIALRDRVDFARSRGANLFVSLHADTLAGEPDVRGASVYTNSDRASDAAAARAAEKENRADIAAGVEADDEARGSVESVLFDLARRETRAFSQIAARDAVEAIREGFRVHKTPLRGAGFRVLRAPDLPSILIELGYLSNAEDLTALQDARQRERLARSLANALRGFAIAERKAGPQP